MCCLALLLFHGAMFMFHAFAEGIAFRWHVLFGAPRMPDFSRFILLAHVFKHIEAYESAHVVIRTLFGIFHNV